MRLLIAIIMLSGCLDVGEQRAKRDLEIGQLNSEFLSVSVDDGLGRIKSHTKLGLQLWAQAPQLSGEIKIKETGRFVFDLNNAMLDADLKVNDSGAAIVTEVVPIENGRPTQKRWAFDVQAGKTYIFTVESTQSSNDPWRFIAFADVQRRIDGVQDLFAPMALDETVRFALISGDLTSQGTVEELTRFQSELLALPFPCFATLGNHELGSGETTFHDFFGRGNFSFEYGGARFTLLDSASATIAEPVWEWLDRWVERGKDKAHLVMMHIPPLDVSGHRNGAFASRLEANTFLNLLERGKVDITIYGHVHTFAAYSNAGIPAYITGGGGAIPMRLDGIGRHFLKVDVDPLKQTFVPQVVRVHPED